MSILSYKRANDRPKSLAPVLIFRGTVPKTFFE